MATLRASTPATAAMKAVLPRFITPAEIARDPSCAAFALMEPRFVTGTTAVSQVANLARPDEPFTQATAANQPAMVTDAGLGRSTLAFGADRIDTLTKAGNVSYSGPWSFLAVATVNNATSVLMHIIGDYASALAGQASIQMNTNGQFRFKVAEASIGLGVGAVNTRYAMIGTYNGAGAIKAKRLDTATATTATAVTTVPTATSLRLGIAAAGWGLHGTIDMAAMFNVDILDAPQSDLLSRVEAMLKQYYGAAVAGGA